MVSRDHELSMRKECELLQLLWSQLYYQPVGESTQNLRFMETIIARQAHPKDAAERGTNSSWKRLGMGRVNLSGHLLSKYPVDQWMARYMKRNIHTCGHHHVRRLMRLMWPILIYQDHNISKKHPRHKILRSSLCLNQ